ncbi:MAG: D-alanine--D-alanine ligase family protein [Gemmatimonadales bacterium]
MNVTVLTGGTTVERDVALATAAQVVQALRSRKHQVQVVDTARGPISRQDEPRVLSGAVGKEPPPLDQLRALEQGVLASGLGELPVVKEAQVLFLCVHGGQGEGGTLQAILDVIGVPYTGSGQLGSALAMDKDLAKKLFVQAGVATPAWLMAPVTAEQVEKELGWPVVVKPSKQGSTVGVTVLRDPKGLKAALALAAAYDDEVMIERFVPGRELTVGILGTDALPVGEIVPHHEIFDYECKYTPGMSAETFPADLPAALARRTQELGVAAHRALKLGGYSRVDFRLDEAGAIFCLEANTLPGMTATSLFPQAARAAGIDFPELCDRICRLAVAARRP